MQKLYVAMHKPYQIPDDPLYVPLQVGAAGREAFCAVGDDAGENISQRNQSFCELTGLYWIRHNTDDDIAGLVHYRRYFSGRLRCCVNGRGRRILSDAELTAMMKDADIILPKKRHYVIETTYSHYAHAHHEKDLQEMRRIIENRCPEYAAAFDTVMNRRSGHRFNMLIMKRDVLNAYCDWLFPLLFELEKRIDLSDYDAYNKRVFGFIGERLLDVWLLNQDYVCKELKVVETDEINWLVKGGRFLWRKFR